MVPRPLVFPTSKSHIFALQNLYDAVIAESLNGIMTTVCCSDSLLHCIYCIMNKTLSTSVNYFFNPIKLGSLGLFL